MIRKWIGQSLLFPIARGSLEGEREKKGTKHDGRVGTRHFSWRAERSGLWLDVMIAGEECQTLGPDLRRERLVRFTCDNSQFFFLLLQCACSCGGKKRRQKHKLHCAVLTSTRIKQLLCTAGSFPLNKTSVLKTVGTIL